MGYIYVCSRYSISLPTNLTERDTMIRLKLLLCFVSFVTLIFHKCFPFSISKHSSSVRKDVRGINWGQINFIHTTDTHGWYSGHLNQKQYSADWGDFVSLRYHLRKYAEAIGVDLLLVDTGDKHDGNGLSDATVPNGAESLPIFMEQDYDLVTIGNHELYLEENSIQEYELLVTRYQENYISSNVEYILENGTTVPFGKKYKYFTTKHQKLNVLSFAFLFNFNRYNSRTKVTPISHVIKQSWFLETLERYQEEVDLLIIFGHIPADDASQELKELHLILRRYYPNTKIQYFGGHSHIRDFKVYDSNSTALQSGRYCETLGWLSINLSYTPIDDSIEEMRKIYSRSYIDFNLKSFLVHSNKTKDDFRTDEGLSLSKKIKAKRDYLELDEVIGRVDQNYYMDYYPYPHKRNIYTLLSETIIPTLKPLLASKMDADRIIMINSGSIRYDLYKGPFTKDTNFIVSPFKNDWVSIDLPLKVAKSVIKILNGQSNILSSDIKHVKNQKPFVEEVISVEGFPSAQQILQGRDQNIDNDLININKLSRGYVTYDDFGHDGDDTPHNAVINYPIPNIIQSNQVGRNIKDDDCIQLIFFDFLRSNVIWALEELNYTADDVQYYSNSTVGDLLKHYIEEGNIL